MVGLEKVRVKITKRITRFLLLFPFVGFSVRIFSTYVNVTELSSKIVRRFRSRVALIYLNYFQVLLTFLATILQSYNLTTFMGTCFQRPIFFLQQKK